MTIDPKYVVITAFGVFAYALGPKAVQYALMRLTGTVVRDQEALQPTV